MTGPPPDDAATAPERAGWDSSATWEAAWAGRPAWDAPPAWPPPSPGAGPGRPSGSPAPAGAAPAGGDQPAGVTADPAAVVALVLGIVPLLGGPGAVAVGLVALRRVRRSGRPGRREAVAGIALGGLWTAATAALLLARLLA